MDRGCAGQDARGQQQTCPYTFKQPGGAAALRESAPECLKDGGTFRWSRLKPEQVEKQGSDDRPRAVMDALFVFGSAVAAAGAIHITPLAEWQRRVTMWPFAENATTLIVPLVWVFLTRRKFADYGLTTAGIGDQLRATARCGAPFAAFALLNSVNSASQLGNVLYVMALGIGALFLFGFLLRKKALPSAAAVPCLFLALAGDGIPRAAGGVIFYMIFVGPAEEVLFRGIIQSRLNHAFGRPFSFFGAKWGWGGIIACVLFGLSHVINEPALFAGYWRPNWWAGPAMFCLALPLAYLRERTGGVLAPAILHCWPQSIAFVLRTLLPVHPITIRIL